MSVYRKFTSLVLAFALLALAGCSGLFGALNGVKGSGTPATTEYDFTDFDEVSIESAFVGTVTRGDAYHVTVTVDDNLVDSLNVRQEGDRVTIGFEQPTMLSNADLSFEITLPALSALEVSGASRVELAGFASGDAFNVEASGASRVEGDIDSGDVDAHASGASSITLLGQGGNLTAEASGASTIDLSGFTTVDASVNASGASTIIVSTTGRLDAEASGASNVRYLGQPTLGNIDGSGGSSIEAQ